MAFGLQADMNAVPKVSKARCAGYPSASRKRLCTVAACGFFLVAALLCADALRAPRTRAVGNAEHHVWEEIWYNWWLADTVLQRRFSAETDLLNHPEGVNVYALMPGLTSPALALPAVFLAGPVVAHNLLSVVCLAAGALGAFWFCLRETGSVAASVFGGVVFGFSPFLQVELANGMLDTCVGTALLPWAGLCLQRLHATLRLRDAVLAAMLIVAALWSSWYLALILAVLAGLLVIAHANDFAGPQGRRLLALYLVTGTLTAVFCIPPLLVISRGGLERGIAWSSLEGPIMDKQCIDVFRLVSHATRRRTLWPFPHPFVTLPFGVYLGKPAAFLAGAALLTPLAAKRWVKTGLLLFVLLALGPYLNVGGRIDWHGVRFPLPNRFILPILPSLTRALALHNYRFMAGATLMTGVLSALALKRLLRFSASRGLRASVIALLVWVTLADFQTAVPGARGLRLPVADAAVPEVLKTLPAHRTGAVLTLPQDAGPSASMAFKGRPMFYQTVHGRPIRVGIDIQTRDVLDAAGPDVPVLVRLGRRLTLRADWHLSPGEVDAGAREMAARGYVFLAVDWSALRSADADRLRRLLEGVFGLPFADSPRMSVYDLRQRVPPLRRGERPV